MRTAGIILFLLYVGVQANAQELRVLAADASGITIEYRPEIQADIYPIGGIQYTHYSIAQSDLMNPMPGAPILPYRKELLVLPGFKGHTVTVLQYDYREEQGITVLPAPSYFTDPSTGEQSENFLIGASYNSAGWQPAQTAWLRVDGIARDRITGSLSIAPVQWDAARRAVRICARIVVRVDFGPLEPGIQRTGSAPAFSLPALNAQQASLWTMAPNVSQFRKKAGATLASGQWYSIPVKDYGIYKLTKSWFQESGIDLTSIDPRTIKLFGNGGRERSVTPGGDPLEGFKEVAIEVVGEADGRFDDGDYVLFYGKSLTGYDYDPVKKKYSHYIHRYGFENSYLLTFGGAQGKRIGAIQSMNEPTAIEAVSFTGREFVDPEEVNMIGSGKLWVSGKMTPGLGGGGNSKTYAMKLEGLIAGEPILYRTKLYSRSDRGTTNAFTITDNSSFIGTVQMGTVTFGTDDNDIASERQDDFRKTVTIPDGRSVVAVSYSASDPAKNLGGYLDWIEWYYPRRFDAVGDILWFNAPDTAATVKYTLNGFSMSDVHIFDISAYDDVKRIVNPDINGGTVRFQTPAYSSVRLDYVAVAAPAFRVPSKAAAIGNSSLQNVSEQADFVIITSPEFLPAAERLKSHRERPTSDRLITKIVPLGEIYNSFNCGVPDPTAIRNFLAFAATNWQVKPRYVLFLGDGNYDYKNIVTQEKNYIPTWQSENSTTLILTYPTDDYYVQIIGDDKIVDLCGGRIPAGSTEEAEDAVSKIIAYETESFFGPWRNKITFVADDHITTKSSNEYFHTTQSETLATEQVPVAMEVDKIYAVSYRTENTAQGRRKPDANKAIIDQLNEGTLAITYTGHGSESVWAHEQILVSDVSTPQLVNMDRLSFVSAATCTFGLYDAPNVKSGTEEMIIRHNGGAIGSLTSPRVVYAEQNFRFNKEFHSALFISGREADGRAKRMGEAIWRAKQYYNSEAGYEKFHLFGDPTVRLLLPPYKVAIDNVLINGQPAAGDTIQIKALSKVTFEASVRYADSALVEQFNGDAEVSLYDSEQRVPVPEFSSTFYYTIRGGLLYRGKASIQNGRFAVTFIVPKDISYENQRGRLSIYVDNQNIDGVGYFDSFKVGGSDTTGIVDGDGPELQLFMDSRTFENGGIVAEDATLLADVFDQNGINTTGLGIGHNIEAWLNSGSQSMILNDYYRGDKDSYQRGAVEYPMKGLPLGKNTLKMRVWDILNNSNTAEIEFTVVSSSQLSIANVYNVPNPMTDGTVFTFQYNRQDPVDAEIKIYTLRGALIKTLERRNITDRFVRMEWDGRDADGDKLANGVYLYKVALRTLDGSYGSEAFGKLSVLR